MFAVVLAGGENRRLPVTKGLIDIGGRRLIESILDRLAAHFEGLAISTNEPEKYFYLGLPMIGDVYPVRGPMTGIFSALSWLAIKEDAKKNGQEKDAPEISAFFAACDMPFVSAGLAARLYETRTPGWEVLAPVWNGRPEPLFSFYSARCLPLLEKSILSGEVSLQGLLLKASVRLLEEDAVKEADPLGRSFVNVNTEDDLKRARQMFSSALQDGGPACARRGVF